LTFNIVSQYAKGKVADIPLVYTTITDPVDAGLLKESNKSNGNITGSSDMQNLDALVAFVKNMLPHTKTIGLLYATSDSNDTALVEKLRTAAASAGIAVLAAPVDQMRDIPIRIYDLKGKVDCIYIGASKLQSATPTIAMEAQKMNIPLINMEDQLVRDGLALACYGVNYEAIGKNTGKIVAKLLKGENIASVTPTYPQLEEYQGFINKKQAEKYGANIVKDAIIVE
jgi:putative ABC transport system substrate-binding protein